MLGNEIGGARFAIGELGMFVDIAPPRDDLANDLRGASVDLGVQATVLGMEWCRRGQRENGKRKQSHARAH
jgi:hypothetical protein